MGRTWGPDGGGIPINAANLNGMETDISTALFSVAALSTKTANYTLTSADKVVVFDGANLTATLPDPTTVANRLYRIKNLNASALFVSSAGTGKMLDATPIRSLARYQAADFVSDGTQWLLLDNNIVAPPWVRALSSNYVTSSAAPITVPATAQVGDMLVVFIGSNYAVSTTPPTGWTLQGNTAQGFHNGAIFTKVCVSGDIGATVTFNLGGSEQVELFCVAVSNSSTTPGTFSVTQNISGSSIASATVTASINDLVLIFASQRLNGMTINSTVGSVLARRTADAVLSSAAFAQTVSTAGVITPTLSSSTSGQGWGEGIIILKPA